MYGTHKTQLLMIRSSMGSATRRPTGFAFKVASMRCRNAAAAS